MTDDAFLAAFSKAVPFAHHVGLQLLSATPDEVVVALDWRPEVDNGAGVMHGGALMSLTDSAASICAFLNLPPGTYTTTSDAHNRFLRPVSAGRATATARPVRVGRTAIILHTEVRDDQGRLAVIASQSQAVIAVPHESAAPAGSGE